MTSATTTAAQAPDGDRLADLGRSKRLLRLLATATLLASLIQAFFYAHSEAAVVLFGCSAIYLSCAHALALENRSVVMRAITFVTIGLVSATMFLANEVLVVGIYLPLLVYISIEERNERVLRVCLKVVLVIIPLQIYLMRDGMEVRDRFEEYYVGLVDVLFAVWAGSYLFQHFLSMSRETYVRRKAAVAELNESVHLIREANAGIEERNYANQCARRSIEQSIHNAHLTRAQLEASNEQLEQFAYAASHDLKEPLRTIRSFMQMERRRLPPALQEDGDLIANFEFVESNALAMHTLLERLLIYSRSGRVAACAKTLDLRRACQQAVVASECSVDRKHALLAALAEQPSMSVHADPQSVQTALREALTNALTFCQPGSEPTVTFTLEISGGRAVCRITDCGIGIEPAYHELVFGLFKRLHPREVYPGAGIGLTLARRSIERSGGKMWLTSEAGAGTTVHIELPLATEPSI